MANLLPSVLNVREFLNVSNAGTAAASKLLTAQAGTVQAVAAASVAAATVASAAASLAGSAAGGAPGPALLMGAQRNSMYASMGGSAATSCDDPAAASSGGGFTMGRFGLGASDPCASRRRRLQSRKSNNNQDAGENFDDNFGDSSGEGNEEFEAQLILMAALVDTILGVSMVLAITIAVHLSLLLWWNYRANREYYAWTRPAPAITLVVRKEPGEPMGIGFRRGVTGRVYVSSLADESQFLAASGAAMIGPGDGVLSANGSRPNIAGIARELRDAEEVYLLVQPVGGELQAKPAQSGTRIVPLPMAHLDDAVDNGRLHASAHTKMEISIVNTSQTPLRLRAEHKRIAKEARARPAFRTLPVMLFWPNVEVTIISSFSSGLVLTSCSVLGGLAVGNPTQTLAQDMALSIGTIVFVIAFYAYEGYKLVCFFTSGRCAAIWKEADPPQSKAEIDDVIMAFAANVAPRLLPPAQASRERGGFEPDEIDELEPGRTERALARIFSWRGGPKFVDMRAGDLLNEIQTWLADSTGTKQGVWYLFALIAIQLLLAGVFGFVLTGALGFSIWLLGFIIIMQLCGAFWSFSKTANDKIDGLEKGGVFVTEMIGLSLITAAYVIGQRKEGDKINLDSLLLSLQLASISASVLMVPIFLPMAITAYNSFVVPVVQHKWNGDVPWSVALAQMLVSAILLPLTIASEFLGLNMGHAGSATDVGEATAISMIEARKQAEQEAEQEERPMAPPCKSKLRRIKHAAFLAAVRQRAEKGA